METLSVALATNKQEVAGFDLPGERLEFTADTGTRSPDNPTLRSAAEYPDPELQGECHAYKFSISSAVVDILHVAPMFANTESTPQASNFAVSMGSRLAPGSANSGAVGRVQSIRHNNQPSPSLPAGNLDSDFRFDFSNQAELFEYSRQSQLRSQQQIKQSSRSLELPKQTRL